MKSVFAVATFALIAGSAAAAPLPRPASFAICGVCHKTDKGAPNGVGPNLYAIGGRTAGTVPGFTYSPAMKNSKVKWTRDELIKYIANPQKHVPGTKMAFAGQKDPKQAELIADYLMSLK